MAAKLVAEEGSLKGLVLSLEDGDHWVIGRDPDACQLLVEDPLASRKHLVCRTTPQGILVENLSTTNPVQVNDVEVKEPRLLQNGDAVKIGSGLFRFYAEAAAQLFKEAAQKETSQIDSFGENNNINTVENKEDHPSPENNGEPSSSPQKTPEEAKEAIKDEQQLPPPSQPSSFPQLSQENASPSNQPQQAPQNPSSTKPTTSPSTPKRRDTIFEEESGDKNDLAEINFGLLDTGRWLLKVVSGPNNGAEFSMQTGSSYIIGTDPNACDIVFHDTSVSRQHVRITIGQEDSLIIEDLKSRNGTIVDGEELKNKRTLPPSTLVTIGTSSFIIFDREGEMQTIISPLMPSIVKVLQEEPNKPPEGQTAEEKAALSASTKDQGTKPAETHIHHPSTTLGAFILIGILTGLFVVVGIGTSTLFKSEPIVKAQVIDPNQALDSALSPFPSIKYTFNKNTGQLLLVGHVLTSSDRSQLLYALQGLSFIKSLDDSGLVIDEFVWRETNQILENNPDWKGINIMATTPGHYVVSGYLKTRTQADRLAEYLSANFPYPELLDKRIIVDEEVVATINTLIQSKGLKTIIAKLENGELTLTGGVPRGKEKEFTTALDSIKEIRGVRNIRNLTVVQAQEESIINITDKYEVTGLSKQGGNLSVVINGRILMKGDALDGMTITKIQPNAIFLEKEGINYRIDFNR